MKKLLFTSLLGLGLLLPANFLAKENSTVKTEFSNTKPKKKSKKANRKEQQQHLQDKTAPITAVLYMSEKEVVVIITQATAKIC